MSVICGERERLFIHHRVLTFYKGHLANISKSWSEDTGLETGTEKRIQNNLERPLSRFKLHPKLSV